MSEGPTAPQPDDVIPDDAGIGLNPTAEPSGETIFPDELQEREWWINWVRALRWDEVDDPDATPTKQPIAPYRTGRAKPVKWNSGLSDEEYPATTFDEAHKWNGMHIGRDIHAPERVVSDGVGMGIIIPVGQGDGGERPITLLDWDDVRQPATGEIHPVAAWAIRTLGGWAEISQSGEGIHQLVFGEIPSGARKFIRHIDDEPFVGDDLPQIEMYRSGRVTAMTGRHVAGTGRHVADGQDVIDHLVLAYLDASNNGPNRPSRPVHADGPDEGTNSRTTHERAAERVRTAVEFEGVAPDEWQIPDGRSLEYHAVLKARERSDELVTTANWELLGYAGVFGFFDGLGTEEILEDLREHPTPNHGHRERKARKEVEGAVRKARNGNFKTPSRATLVSRGILPESWATEPTATTTERHPVAAVPFSRFDNAAGQEDTGEIPEFPTTTEARGRLRDRILQAFRASQSVTIDAPTSLGKSHTVAAEPWLYRTDITGDAPVIHLAPTRDARDENVGASKGAGVSTGVLKGRTEKCPVCRGDHDPNPDGEDPDVMLTVDGEPISEWIAQQCDVKGLPFQMVHSYVHENNDQFIDLPCSGEGSDCPAVTQWDGKPWADEGGPSHDVIHATHAFAYVPSLRNHCNVVIDETPDYTVDLNHHDIRSTITAYLQTIGAPTTTFESFIQLAQFTGGASDAASEQDELERAIESDPEREWYIKHPDAHALAPALARAIYNALHFDDPDENGRRSATVLHEPPRFDEDSDAGFGGNWLSVVVDDENTVRTVRHTPGFATARSVVGLDAHPAPHVWQRNIGPMMDGDLSMATILSPTERRFWRRVERGLTVVRVGDATRPLSGSSARQWFDDDRAFDVFVRELREHVGADFRTAITTTQVESMTRERMSEAGVRDPETMHFGEEKSRNDFGGESVGLVNGCMDPGDDYVLDLLAELGLDATVPRADPQDFDDPENAHCGHCSGDGCNQCNQTGRVRERGREFIGPDAGVAAELLASVRENHVAQAVGRYARAPDDPENTATVYVRTDAVPDGLVDYRVAGVEWVATELQRDIVRQLSRADAMTAKTLSERVDCSKEHVRKTMSRLEERGLVSRSAGTGAYGADEFHANAGADVIDEVDLGAGIPDHQTANDPILDSSMWSLAIMPESNPTQEQATVETDGGVETPPDDPGFVGDDGG